jgi:phosphoenolpyruvate synthase/pyruvate phosphate dikinase
MIDQYVRDLRELGEAQVASVGGKAANLGELTRIGGVRVPAGFCLTTAAFRRVMAGVALPDPGAASGAEVRQAIESVPIPADIRDAVIEALDEHAAYAVRSSATAEDLPTASFAGQQDTYLNVVGAAAVLESVSRCWASLFTDRAIAYRLRNGIDHRQVEMAVVVQRMVDPDASGVLFTADPVTGNRKVATVDAVPGLGEALVSGLVNPEAFKVRDAEIVSRTAAATTLTDAQVLELARLGRRIEAHFGRPQDIEWCRDADGFAIVQSRPITTLFPIPVAADEENHVYLSVGHQQMMTDAMKPLGISVWQLTAMAAMQEAGGRLFVDATRQLSRPGFLEMVGRGDPLFRDALETLLDRGFVGSSPAAAPAAGPGGPPPHAGDAPIATDPAIVTELIERSEKSLAALRRDIEGKTGPALFDFLTEAFEEHKRVLTDPLSIQAIMAGMGATWWLNDHLQEWLGEKNAADTLTLSAPHNITSEMGLALLDVADAIRPYPEAIAFLRGVTTEDFLDELPKPARDAIEEYLGRYGMRCAGEIDITRPRWSERPTTLVPLILDNIKLFEPGAAARRFEQGRLQAAQKEEDLLRRLRSLPGGAGKADETVRMIERLRTFIGYREYPKYGIIARYFVYKQALLDEAERLVQRGVLAEKEDVFFLTFPEIFSADHPHAALVRQRKEEFRVHQALTPPRVITSEGEVLQGSYRRDDAPAGALIGLAVSPGTVEGRARVIHDMAEADLEAGDILVTAYTDPSWSPLFVAIAGLVTEVGGLMTHGAVIAREYGLPSVVGVADATRLIADGQRIRVHGSEGYVEILPSS